MDQSDEKQLVEKAKCDAQAFGKLFDLYYPKIFGFTLRRIGNVDAAKDITSAVFVKVLHNIRAFRWKSSFSSWIYRIATNEVNDFFRKKQKSPFSLDTLM